MADFRGIFEIAQTPFDAAADLIWEDFEKELEFIVAAGSHGIVWPVMASEFTEVSYNERVEGFKRAVDVIKGRIPFMAGVADTTKSGAVDLAKAAKEAGADSVIAMPPWHEHYSTLDLQEAYYRALADAAQLPVCIQNCGPPLGSSLAGRYVVELCKKIPLVQYLKEEKPPQGHAVQEVIDLGGDEVKGVFSGASTNYIIPEYKRGVCGNMPGAYIPDINAQIWDMLEEGKEDEARALHNIKAAFENCLGAMPRRRGRKMVLAQRGVFAPTSTYGRGAAAEKWDAIDQQELDYALSLIQPYTRV